jgi:hypothetical protein
MAVRLDRRGFLLSSGAIGGWALAGCASAPEEPASPATPASPTPSSTPTPTPAAPAAPSAPVAAATGFPLIADTATRLDAGKARALRAQGVRTVFRYYSFVPPTLPGKHLEPEEARIILGEGLSIGAVFQHFNNCFRTFENKWGREDAEQALRQAQAISQPAGSAIYFGVDGDWPWASTRDAVVAYFEDVKRAFEGSGYAVGVYSNGCLCNSVMEKGLASYAWLSGSTGHSGTQAFYNTGKWTLFQNALDITPSALGFPIDCNLSNPLAGGYFGQFDSVGASTATHSAAATVQALGARRFLKGAGEVRSTPDGIGAVLTTLRKDSNVLLMQTAGDWSQIQTQEGAPNRSGQAVTGWLPNTLLAPMDRFPDAGASYGLCGSGSQPTDAQKYVSCERATFRVR